MNPPPRVMALVPYNVNQITQQKYTYQNPKDFYEYLPKIMGGDGDPLDIIVLAFWR